MFVLQPVPSTASTISDDWTHLQDRLILAFNQEAILDILIVISSTLQGSKYALLVLDIFYHLFEREDPAKLVYPESSKAKMVSNFKFSLASNFRSLECFPTGNSGSTRTYAKETTGS